MPDPNRFDQHLRDGSWESRAIRVGAPGVMGIATMAGQTRNCKCHPAGSPYRQRVTTLQIIGLCIAIFLMSLGILGSIVPGLPSTPIVFLAATAHKLYFGESGPAWWVILVLALLMVASLAVDYAASILGAKKLGATWRGALGAVVGGLVGLFFSLPGILLGPFIGAVVFELAGGRDWRQSSKAGVGATLGLVAGALGKIGVCLIMIALFAINVVYRSLHG